MSLDRRLREELRQEAAAIEPDVERQLGAVEAGARRRDGVGASWLLLAAAIVVAAIILRLPNGQATGPAGPGPSVAPSLGVSASPSTPASYPQIAGTYTATLDPTDATLVNDGVAGTWTMRLEPTGAVVISGPTSFLVATGHVGDRLLPDRRSLPDQPLLDQLLLDLGHRLGAAHCASVGNYVWNLAGGRLSFTSVDDTCSMRKTLLTTTPWLTSK